MLILLFISISWLFPSYIIMFVHMLVSTLIHINMGKEWIPGNLFISCVSSDSSVDVAKCVMFS